MIRTRLAVAAAATCLTILGACEKPAGPPTTASNSAMSAAQAAAAGAGQIDASTLPDLPLVAKPVFSPDFVDTAGSMNLFEIAQAKLAQAHTTNPEVKAYAEDMAEAHGKSDGALQAALDASGQTIELPDSLPDVLQAKVTVLGQTTGVAFDRIYLTDQVAAHQASVTALTTYATRGDFPALKTYAKATLKTEQADLTRAQALLASLK